MKKLTLNALAFYVSILGVFSQSTKADSSYASKKLTVSEVNLVSGYYTQDGSHSAVTGGIGSEKLTDISNTVEVTLTKVDSRRREHSLNIEVGIDHYTSASSDKINPATVSSASYADTRIYPSVGYSVHSATTGTTFGITGSFSTEYDYLSKGIGVNFSKAAKDNNREFGIRLQAYFDEWKVILPVELRTAGEREESTSPRNSYSASLSYSQVLNKRLQIVLLGDAITQNGLLGTSYQRVYFSNGAENYEHLPANRLKIPLGIKANYFVSDRFILRTFYRYYTDDWGIRAHTAEVELPVKLSPFFSVSPFYRFYTQTAADYFAPYNGHAVSESYFTSDYDLSAFSSRFYGAGLRLTPPNGFLGLRQVNALELRYGHYSRNNDLNSDILSLYVKFK